MCTDTSTSAVLALQQHTQGLYVPSSESIQECRLQVAAEWWARCQSMLQEVQVTT
jgi:hypothetical protein